MIPSSLGMQPQAQPWTSDGLDVESVNQKAGQALVASVQALRTQAQQQLQPQTRVHVVLGPPGAGKTHLFGRLRRKLGPRATLVHLRPLVGSDIRPRYLIGQVFNQLAQVTHEITQADSLVGALIAWSRGADAEKPRLMLEDFRRTDSNDQHRVLERIIENTLSARPDLDEAVLRALLQLPTLSTLFRTAMLSWLGGFDLDPAQSARIGVTGALPDERLMGALRTLAAIAAGTAPLVLVFDQLENLIDASDADGRVRAYASLVAELVDSVPGLVLIQMAVDSDWARDIEPRLGQAQKSRVLGQRHLLQLPSIEQRQELLQHWVARLPAPEAPFPWPFTNTQVSAWTTAPGMTPRMLLLTAEHALLEGESTGPTEQTPPQSSPDDQLQKQWQRHLESARVQLDEAAQMNRGPEAEHWVDALLLLAPLLGAKCRVTRDGVTYLNLDERPQHVSVLHDVHPQTIAARMRRWLGSNDSRVVLREQWRAFPTTWHAVNRLADELSSQPSVRVYWVGREDVARLLALRSLVMQARSHDVVGATGQPITDAEVTQWIQSRCSPEQWPLSSFITGESLDTQKPPAANTTRPPPVIPHSKPPAERRRSSPNALSTAQSRTLQVLEHLRVASLDRLARETAARGVPVTRKQIIEELKQAGAVVRWFGRSIVALVPEDGA